MIFDYEQPLMIGMLMAFPDWPFVDLPRQNPVNEVIVIDGTSGDGLFLTGSAD